MNEQATAATYLIAGCAVDLQLRIALERQSNRNRVVINSHRMTVATFSIRLFTSADVFFCADRQKFYSADFSIRFIGRHKETSADFWQSAHIKQAHRKKTAAVNANLSAHVSADKCFCLTDFAADLSVRFVGRQISQCEQCITRYVVRKKRANHLFE